MLDAILKFCKLQPIPAPEPSKKRVDTSHIGGPIYTKEQIEEHDPAFKAVPYDVKTKKPAQLTAGKHEFHKYYINPSTDLDFIVAESLLNSTLLGPLSQALTRLLVAGGLKPMIKLHNEEHLTAEEKDKMLQKYQYVLDDLAKVTDSITEHNDVSWTDLVTQLIQQTVDFGRGAILFDNFDNPKNAMLVHARDMNITEISKWGNFESVQMRFMANQVSRDDMVYLYNPIQSSQKHSAGPYGVPMILPALDDARALLRVPKSLENLAKNTYAGAYTLIIKPQGSTMESKKTEYQQLTRHYKAGTVNILLEDPDEVKTEEVNWKPEFAGLIETADHLKKNIAVALGLPVSLISQHDINRASLLGAIQLVMKTSILPTRAMLARQITKQFYMKHFLKQHSELAEILTVELGFHELQIASYLDLTASALAIDSRAELTPKAFGTLIGLDNYENMTIPDAEITKGGNSGKMQNESYNEKGES